MIMQKIYALYSFAIIRIEVEGKKMTPQQRFAAKYRKRYTIDLFANTEADIIEKLESVPNRAGYIKALIRADIAKKQK